MRFTVHLSDGRSIKLDAPNKEAPQNELIRRKVNFISLVPYEWSNILSLNLALGKKELVPFTRQLATMLLAGIPLFEALQSLQQGVENKRFSHSLMSIQHEIAQGNPLHVALQCHPKYFDDLQRKCKVGANRASPRCQRQLRGHTALRQRHAKGD